MSENPAASQPSSPTAQPAAIWAPWRLAYLESLPDAPAAGRPGVGARDPAGFLARYWATPGDDEANHVIVRDAHGMILLNAFPYANGHLLVALGDPRPTLLDYDPAQRARLWSLCERAMELMRLALEPQGVNLGINQGRAAGAGVPDHLHAHLVPRWGGDVNFMQTVGNVRVIPSSLEQMAERYRAAAKVVGTA